MSPRRALLAIAAGTAAVGLMMAATVAVADVGKWREGTNYSLVAKPQAPASAGKVQVVEYFWYGCGHCYQLDPELEAWNERKPEFIEFTRVPVAYRGPARQHARLYYTLQALNRLDLHAKVFAAIHQDGRQLTHREEATTRRMQFGLLANFGVTQEQFDAAYDSAEVLENVKRAEESTVALAIASVPTLIVNGKYTTGVPEAGGTQELLALITDLAASERAR